MTLAKTTLLAFVAGVVCAAIADFAGADGGLQVAVAVAGATTAIVGARSRGGEAS